MAADEKKPVDDHGAGDPGSSRSSLSDSDFLKNVKDAWNDSDTMASPSDHGAFSAPIPERIGTYRIVSVLGQGGMGIVYEAEQQQPKRAVALKVVRGGHYVDEHRIRLFLREAQTLARMKHPSIAAIYESGRTEDGQHFFGMELVRGVPLAQYVSENELTTGDKLSLFVKICDAVNYAHQRGVIHRDLKPSNIIIEQGGTPKILDFGLAKITETDVAATTIVTDVGRIQGTLTYMSPEQARGNPDEIDLRSDVYSLGVIFYELVTGELPYDVSHTVLHEATRVICEVEPRRPSLLNQSAKGDLETIALKALSKEPERRYQSAAGIAEDVERFLKNQPIHARPPSTGYQLRKAIARHKLSFSILSILLVTLVAFGISMGFMYAAEQRQRTMAEANAKTAEQVSGFLLNLFNEADPAIALGAEPSVHSIVESGIKNVKKELHDEPLARAEVMVTLGRVSMGLGMLDEAQELLDAALPIQQGVYGAEHPALIDTLLARGTLKRKRGKPGEALDLFEQATGIAEKNAEVGMLKALDCRHHVAQAHFESGNMQEAERLLRDVTTSLREQELDKDGKKLLSSVIKDLGYVLNKVHSQPAEALVLYKEVLDIRKEVFEPNHPEMSGITNSIGSVYYSLGDHESAADFFLQSIDIRRKVLGADHPKLATPLANLGYALCDLGRYGKAIELCEEALDIYRNSLEDNPKKEAFYLDKLAQALNKKAFYELGDSPNAPMPADAYRALDLGEEALRIRRRHLDENSPSIAGGLYALGEMYRKWNRLDDAERCQRESIAIWNKHDGKVRCNISFAMMGLARVLLDRDLPMEAAAMMPKAIEIRTDCRGANHHHVADARVWYAECLLALGRHDDAIAQIDEAYPILCKVKGFDDARVVATRELLSRVYGDLGDSAKSDAVDGWQECPSADE